MGKEITWGMMGYLTPEQKEMLANLRKRVDTELPKKSYLEKDTSLLRYCRARNFNPTKTWSMLKEDVEWREPFEGYVYFKNRDFGGAYAMHEEGAIRLGGKSKDGRPVIMVQARYYWPKLIEDNLQIVYFFTFYVDAICRMAEAIGEETFFAVADLEGFSMANFSFSQIKLAISILQNHYPERLGMIFVINAPWAFTAAWRAIQPLLDERTRNKIDILGSDYFQVISAHISPDQIEKQYGGTHDRFPIPDEIVQIAIDNELRALNPSQLTAAAISDESKVVVTASAVLPPPLSAERASGGSSLEKSASRKTLGIRRSVRKLVRKMLFTTENRAEANSLGVDPDGPESELPKPLTSSSNLVVRRSPSRKLNDEEDGSEVDPAIDLEKELFEIKLAHDKLLAKVETIQAEMIKKGANHQKQIYFLLALLILGIAMALAK